MRKSVNYPDKGKIRPHFIIAHPILYFIHCFRTKLFKELVFRIIEISLAAFILSFSMQIVSLAFPGMGMLRYKAILVLTFFYVSIPSLGYIYHAGRLDS